MATRMTTVPSLFSCPPSVITRLHPLAKVGVAGAMTLLALLLTTPLALALPCLFVLTLLILARPPLRPTLLVGGAVLIVLVAGVNDMIDGSIASAAANGMRLLLLLMTIPVTAFTTEAQTLARALAAWRLPSGLVVAVLLVWRFFPFLLREQHAIREARQLRGMTPRGQRGVWLRASVLPVIFSSIEYADRLTLALELRGFDPSAPRSWYRVPRFTRLDALFLLTAAAVMLISLVLTYRGVGG